MSLQFRNDKLEESVDAVMCFICGMMVLLFIMAFIPICVGIFNAGFWLFARG